MHFHKLAAMLLGPLVAMSALASGNHAGGHDNQAIGRSGLLKAIKTESQPI